MSLKVPGPGYGGSFAAWLRLPRDMSDVLERLYGNAGD